MGVTIYHNPECGTSRNVLEIIKASGEEPEIVLYLQRGWTRELLAGLLSAADLTPRQALRTSKSPAEELGLTDPSVDDSILFEAMLKHPILVNRPIVVTKKERYLDTYYNSDWIKAQGLDLAPYLSQLKGA